MEWYGEKMLPRGLPELIYQIVPQEIVENLKVISLNKKREKGLAGRVGDDGNYWVIQLYPTIILKGGSGGRLGTQSFCYWSKFLGTILHEIGHITTKELVPRMSHQRYVHDLKIHNYIERLADDWRDQTIEKIGSRDPRLGQPLGWIGGLPGIYLLRGVRTGMKDKLFGKFKNEQIKNVRAKKCDGQHGIDDIVRMVWNYSTHRYRRRILRIIKKVAPSMGITRAYIDRAGRKHLFFNHGEAMAISAEVQKNTSLKKWIKEEENKRRKEAEVQEDFSPDDIPF